MILVSCCSRRERPYLLPMQVTSPEESEHLLGALTWAATPSQQDQLLSMLLTEEIKLQVGSAQPEHPKPHSVHCLCGFP